MPEPKIIDPKNLKATLTRKVGPAPVWVWIVVGAGVVYVYKKATSPEAPAATAETSDASDAGGYPAFSGYGGEVGYDAGSASYDGSGGGSSGFPESIPLSFEGSIPVEVTVARPPRRHQRNPKIAKITQRIEALKEGGVTKAERPKIQQLRKRRKTLRGK
jgi:hypothetical protein